MIDISNKLTLVSLGGNALIRRGEKGTIEEQLRNAKDALEFVARLFPDGEGLIITHGNGPVVGNIVLQGEAARSVVPPMPLYIADAESVGAVGALIQQTLYNELMRRGGSARPRVVTIVTQVVVSASDPAFTAPSKPIGPFYSSEEAKMLEISEGFVTVEVLPSLYRRVVPSPKPRRIVEAEVISSLINAGVIVIAAGGGGVPVVEAPDGTLSGVEAVIDKDRSAALLALSSGAERIVTLTDIDMVYKNLGKDNEEGVESMTPAEARLFLKEGHFPPGSMGPKVESAVEFVDNGGREVIITNPELMEDALQGRAGTRVWAGGAG